MLFLVKPPKTIRGKLVFITLSGLMSALLIFSVTTFIYDAVQYRGYLNREMMVLAQVIGQNCEAALLFRDSSAATSTLDSLDQERRVLAAHVVLPDGSFFASYSLPPWTEIETNHACPMSGPEVVRQGDQLIVSSPIRVENNTVGAVILHVSLGEYFRRLWVFALIVLLVATLSATLGLLMTRRFQRFILNPIQELVLAARLISQEKNYRFRVVKRFDDEIGILIDSFNEMLIQIQDRTMELTQNRDEMEDRVNARTRQLQDEVEERKRTQIVVNNLLMKISEDNEKLVRLDEMKSEFLSIVSHELRTPLTAITGYLKLLNGGSAGPLNEMQKDFLQTVLRNADRLYNLVNDLLDLSRLESGKMNMNFSMFDLGMMLDQSVKGLRSLAEQKKISIEVKKPDAPVSFEVDVQRMEQVIVNLMGNSLKFTPNQGVVELGGKRDVREGKDGVRIWVKDTGVGIPKEALSKIFDKFYQVENSSTRKTGGTGLGLAITSKLVEAHKGAIWVESEEGKGSTFSIFLPLKQAAPGEHKPETPL